MKTSLNNNLILTPYSKTRELKETQLATGFAGTSQKVSIESLELLIDTIVTLGYNKTELLPAGSKIYFKESTLFTQKWAREVYEGTDGKFFVIGNAADILYVET